MAGESPVSVTPVTHPHPRDVFLRWRGPMDRYRVPVTVGNGGNAKPPSSSTVTAVTGRYRVPVTVPTGEKTPTVTGVTGDWIGR